MISLAQQELNRRRQSVTYINLAPESEGRQKAKRKVQSQRSENWDESAHPRAEAGSPEGGQFVPAGEGRDERGRNAQQNTRAKQNYEETQLGKKKIDSSMSDDELKELSEYAYSFKSSDKQVVAQRVQIANELARRGMDVNDHGGLGKGGGGSSKPKGKRRKSSGSSGPAKGSYEARVAAVKAKVRERIYKPKKKKS